MRQWFITRPSRRAARDRYASRIKVITNSTVSKYSVELSVIGQLRNVDDTFDVSISYHKEKSGLVLFLITFSLLWMVRWWHTKWETMYNKIQYIMTAWMNIFNGKSIAQGFMTHVTCRLTAKNRDQLRNPALGSRVWATFVLIFSFQCFSATCWWIKAVVITASVRCFSFPPTTVGDVPCRKRVQWVCHRCGNQRLRPAAA